MRVNFTKPHIGCRLFQGTGVLLIVGAAGTMLAEVRRDDEEDPS